MIWIFVTFLLVMPFAFAYYSPLTEGYGGGALLGGDTTYTEGVGFKPNGIKYLTKYEATTGSTCDRVALLNWTTKEGIVNVSITIGRNATFNYVRLTPRTDYALVCYKDPSFQTLHTRYYVAGASYPLNLVNLNFSQGRYWDGIWTTRTNVYVDWRSVTTATPNQIVFNDSFNRVYNCSVGYGWQETEEGPCAVKIEGGKLRVGDGGGFARAIRHNLTIKTNTLYQLNFTHNSTYPFGTNGHDLAIYDEGGTQKFAIRYTDAVVRLVVGSYVLNLTSTYVNWRVDNHSLIMDTGQNKVVSYKYNSVERMSLNNKTMDSLNLGWYFFIGRGNSGGTAFDTKTGEFMFFNLSIGGTPPIPPAETNISINTNTYDVTSAYKNNQIWRTIPSTPAYTFDSTPTTTFTTTQIGNCSVSRWNWNYTRMIANDSTSLCSTTNTNSMSCTLGRNLPFNLSNIYLSCIKSNGKGISTGAFSTSGALAIYYNYTPRITYQQSPANNSAFNVKKQISFTCNITSSSQITDFKNATLKIEQGGLVYSKTKSESGTSFNEVFNTSLSNEGKYNYSCSFGAIGDYSDYKVFNTLPYTLFLSKKYYDYNVTLNIQNFNVYQKNRTAYCVAPWYQTNSKASFKELNNNTETYGVYLNISAYTSNGTIRMKASPNNNCNNSVLIGQLPTSIKQNLTAGGTGYVWVWFDYINVPPNTPHWYPSITFLEG